MAGYSIPCIAVVRYIPSCGNVQHGHAGNGTCCIVKGGFSNWLIYLATACLSSRCLSGLVRCLETGLMAKETPDHVFSFKIPFSTHEESLFT